MILLPFSMQNVTFGKRGGGIKKAARPCRYHRKQETQKASEATVGDDHFNAEEDDSGVQTNERFIIQSPARQF